MNIQKVIHSKNGRVILSIILGLGLSTIFRKACSERNCLVFKAPEFKEIQNKIFSHKDKCYTFNEATTKCDASKRVLDFA
jgi:hypothetical protein